MTNPFGITHAAASTNILRAVETRSLTQKKWHGKGAGGREIACLLGSIDKRVSSPSDCNADLMPLWLAELTPVLFDGIAADQIYLVAERYGRAVDQWGRLSDDQWSLILTRFFVRCIDDALDAARPLCVGQSYWQAVEDVCAQCKAAITSGDGEARAKAGREAAQWEMAAGTTAARMAAKAAARAAAPAARAKAAAQAAEAAAQAAAAATTVARANAAWKPAYFKLFTFLLDCIEAEIAAT